MTIRHASNAEYRVLTVDDNTMSIHLVSSMLKSKGFSDIEIAMNGDEALQKIAEAQSAGRPYDIVFLDWNMPGISGYEVLRQCRENAALNRMAIVMLTAENQKRFMLEAIKVGATSYIVKPLSQEELDKKLSQIFEWFDKQAGN